MERLLPSTTGEPCGEPAVTRPLPRPSQPRAASCSADELGDAVTVDVESVDRFLAWRSRTAGGVAARAKASGVVTVPDHGAPSDEGTNCTGASATSCRTVSSFREQLFTPMLSASARDRWLLADREL